MELICPICKELLQRQDRSLVCQNNHSYDIARQGYVNLLTVQQKHSLNPGDTREQVLSRRAFLEAGYYAPSPKPLPPPPKNWGPTVPSWMPAAARATIQATLPSPWAWS